MEKANIAHLVAAATALAAGVAACGSSDTRMRPDVPSDVTTTTSGPIQGPSTDITPVIQPAPPMEPAPAPGTPDTTTQGAAPTDIVGAPAAGATPTPAPVADGSQGRHAEAPLSDPEIAAVIDAAIRAERQVARETLKRAKSEQVTQLALRVTSDHGSAKLDRVERKTSLSPLENPTSAQVTSSAAHAVQALQSSNDQDFDWVSIRALAAQERQFLRLLDETLIPEAENGELRTLLQELRASVASRVGTASEIESSGGSRGR